MGRLISFFIFFNMLNALQLVWLHYPSLGNVYVLLPDNKGGPCKLFVCATCLDSCRVLRFCSVPQTPNSPACTFWLPSTCCNSSATFLLWSTPLLCSAGKQHVIQWSALTGERGKSRASPPRSSIPTAKRDECCVGSKMARCTAGALGFVPSKLPTSSGLGDCWVCGAGIMENRVTPASLHACFVTSKLILQLQKLESRFLNKKLNFWPLWWTSEASYNRLCQMSEVM